MIAAASVSSRQHARSQRARPLIDKKLRLIDISQQQLHSLPGVVIEHRLWLEHLVADGNLLTENALHIPRFPRLRTLSLNANKIRDVGLLLQHLQEACPRLECLSLIGNPGWPHPIVCDDVDRYRRHRQLTARALPRLQFLDAAEVRRKTSTSSISSFSSCTTPSPPSTPEATPPPSPLPEPRHRSISHRGSARTLTTSEESSFLPF